MSEPCRLPDDALLARYRRHGHHVDCFVTTVPGTVPLESYVRAFYTTWLFRLERVLLRLVRKPSRDADLAALLDGTRTKFAAWTLESRRPDELLMCDYLGRTRSWFKVAPADGGTATRLMFGSAVLPVRNAETGQLELGGGYSALMGFHKMYSHALLRAARAKLR